MSRHILRSRFFLSHLLPFFPARHNRPGYHDSHTPARLSHPHQLSKYCMAEAVPIFARLFCLLSAPAHPVLLCRVCCPTIQVFLFSVLETTHDIPRSPFDTPMTEKD